ncbi:hypothetical protein DFH07DRAFT_836056 [Mycena maculata]|uniref:Uncharacterized protein n=1 Tax=Mycena maculata TaxID=230809 RepID=A0AAD7N3C5_9AGAR|nr:hypothetical protein DFH07DRAFT_836056 [Mycena maculata]
MGSTPCATASTILPPPSSTTPALLCTRPRPTSKPSMPQFKKASTASRLPSPSSCSPRPKGSTRPQRSWRRSRGRSPSRPQSSSRRARTLPGCASTSRLLPCPPRPRFPPAPIPSAPATTTSSFEFAVGGKKRKGDELAAETNKRGKPNKAAFHHWVQFGPVNTDTKATGPAPGFFKKVLDGGGLGKLILPTHYIERSASDPAFLGVGFTGANEANMFMGAWSGANLDPALRGITARLAVAVGPSTSNYSFLTGN